MTPRRPVLRYHGGKWMLAPWIIANMPPHRVYVEPFGGGGSVLMRKPPSYAEVYNDRWDTVVNVFQVLRDELKCAELKRLLELTPFARTEFNLTSGNRPSGHADVEAARRSILRSFAGFGSASTNGDYSTGFRANAHRSGTTPAHDWRNYPEQLVAFIHRLRGVTVENKDAIAVIEQHDSPETLFYIDPPYVHSTRNMDRGNAAYAHEMTDADHRRLAELLRSVSGMVMVSGYPSDLYEELYSGWKRIKRPHIADGARKRTEVLWLNEATQKAKKAKNQNRRSRQTPQTAQMQESHETPQTQHEIDPAGLIPAMEAN